MKSKQEQTKWNEKKNTTRPWHPGWSQSYLSIAFLATDETDRSSSLVLYWNMLDIPRRKRIDRKMAGYCFICSISFGNTVQYRPALHTDSLQQLFSYQIYSSSVIWFPF